MFAVVRDAGARRRRRCSAPTSFVVVADRLADPGNLGTILRSAEAAGVDAVVLTPGTVDVFNPKVVRASAGALFHVPVVHGVARRRRAPPGLRLVGTSSHRGDRHTEADWSGRLAIVAGNEAHGLADDAPVDEWVRIEHRGPGREPQRGDGHDRAVLRGSQGPGVSGRDASVAGVAAAAHEPSGLIVLELVARPGDGPMSGSRCVPAVPEPYRGQLCTDWRDGDFGAPGDPGDGELEARPRRVLSPPGALPAGSR